VTAPTPCANNERTIARFITSASFRTSALEAFELIAAAFSRMDVMGDTALIARPRLQALHFTRSQTRALNAPRSRTEHRGLDHKKKYSVTT
jgi:hypothetical protein